LFKQNASPSGAEFRSLVETMLQTPDHAVPTATLNGDLGIASRASKVLKEFHALMYHVPSRTYRFYSPAYLHAARKMLDKTRIESPRKQMSFRCAFGTSPSGPCRPSCRCGAGRHGRTDDLNVESSSLPKTKKEQHMGVADMNQKGLLAILLWYLVNISTVVLNKWIFQKMEFPFPLLLTQCHMLMSYLLALIVLRVLRLMPETVVSSQDRWNKIAPLAYVLRDGSVVVCRTRSPSSNADVAHENFFFFFFLPHTTFFVHKCHLHPEHCARQCVAQVCAGFLHANGQVGRAGVHVRVSGVLGAARV
jgi:hypothetical protein